MVNGTTGALGDTTLRFPVLADQDIDHLLQHALALVTSLDTPTGRDGLAAQLAAAHVLLADIAQRIDTADPFAVVGGDRTANDHSNCPAADDALEEMTRFEEIARQAHALSNQAAAIRVHAVARFARYDTADGRKLPGDPLVDRGLGHVEPTAGDQ